MKIPTFEELIKKFNLDTEEQKKLIEILLIVGSILVALKLPDSMIWIFMLFVISAILYFITIKKKPSPYIFLPLAVSSSFTGILVTVFAMNMNTFFYIKVIIFVTYWILFTIIICLALIRR